MNLEEIEKLDVEKLHNEVNQLRNQELLVNSFAITMVIVGASVILNLSDKDTTYIKILFLILLILIDSWQDTLLVTRMRIATYLRVLNLSKWERYYRNFVDENKTPSMRITTAYLFIILGFIICFAEKASLIYLLLTYSLFFLLSYFLLFYTIIFSNRGTLTLVDLLKQKLILLKFLFLSIIFLFFLLQISSCYFFIYEVKNSDYCLLVIYIIYNCIIYHFGFRDEKIIINECEQKWKRIIETNP